MVLREQNDTLSQSRGIMGPLENSTGVQNNRGRLKQRFDLIRKLGQGTYGKVQLGIDKETGQEVAIKTIKKSKIETEADLIRIQREIQIMSSVRHPNIIHIYEVFENREKMVLVMEYAAGGELYDYLNERKTLSDDEAKRIFRQIASATYYCHKHNICHRDLKLENILLDEKSNAKIADFGLSNVFDDIHLLKTFCGSPLYASPEIVRGTPYYGPEVDCWSLGVLLYTLVYGAMPFDGSNFKRLVKQISNGDYYEPSRKSEASNLIRLMLTVDPLKRATIKDVCSHPWLNAGFPDQCLAIAEGLANQTPVRLDLLLSLAPGSSPGTMVAKLPSAERPSEEGAAAAPKKAKGKRDAEAPEKCPAKEKEPKVVKVDPKRKQAVKKKSKSSPLLELIVDVEEEEKEQEMDGDADTLSEISEIQTIAEDAPKSEPVKQEKELKSLKLSGSGAKLKASGGDVKSVSPKSNSTTAKDSGIIVEEMSSTEGKKVEKVPERINKEPAISPKPKEKSPVPIKKSVIPEPEPKVKEKSPIPPKSTIPEPEVPKVKEKSPMPAPKPVIPEPQPKPKEKSPMPSPVAPKPEPQPVAAKSKEKSPLPLKPTPNEVSPASGKAVPSDNEVKQEKEGESKPETATVKLVKKKVMKPKVKEVAEKDQEKGSSGTDNESSGPTRPKSTIVKMRSSDSGGENNTSPTRVERRNSKVISQKTAELIQNLEAKTGTSSSEANKGKKLTLPLISKVSDVKSRFETTPDNASPTSIAPKPLMKTVIPAKPKPSQAEKPIEKTEPTKKEVLTPKTQESVKPKEAPAPAQTTEANKISVPKSKPKSKSPSPVPPPTTEEKNIPPPSVEEKKQEELSKKVSPPTPAAPAAAPPKPSPTAADKPNLRVKIIPIQHVQDENQKVLPSKSGAVSAPVQKPAEILTSPPVTSPVSRYPPPTPDTPSINSKEQAAKKIGSVIQRIVSSESVEKGLDAETNNNANAKKGSFKTEIQKFVQAAPTPDTPKPTQRTEVRFPVAAAGSQERIIPIQLTDEVSNGGTANSSRNNSGTSVNTRFPPRIDSMRSSASGLSRQNSSDTESSLASSVPHRMEALKKSPREFIIPIKIESSGHTVTPKEDLLNSTDSLTEDNFRLDSRLRPGRFTKRFNSILSDSSVEDVPVSAGSSRRSSGATTTGAGPSHSRSLSQGDEPTTPGTFKRYRRLKSGGLPLDKSDSFSSADDEDEDTFEVLTAESLFSSLLDRVRNLTKRLNRESSVGQNWSESPGIFAGGESPFREFMSRAPSEAQQFIATTTPGSYSSPRRSYSREPSVTVTITSGGPSWRRSLSRDVSGESDSVLSEAVSRSSSQNAARSKSESESVRHSFSSSANSLSNNDGDDENDGDDN